MSSTKAIFALSAVLVLEAGCTGGPGFFKQSGTDRTTRPAAAVLPPPTLVAATELNGVVKATVQPSAELTQIVKASDAGSIAGTSVTFPPGSLAVETEITVSPSENLSSAAVIGPLGLGTSVTASGAAVAVASSAAMDTAQPFRISLSLPDGAGLTDGDRLANLIVIYKIRLSETGALVTGVIPRAEIKTDGGRAEISTRHFGSFQAALTAAFVAEAKEVPTPVPAAIARSYYVRGAATTAAADDGQRAAGFQGWAWGLTRAKVGDAATLSAGVLSRPRAGE